MVSELRGFWQEKKRGLGGDKRGLCGARTSDKNASDQNPIALVPMYVDRIPLMGHFFCEMKGRERWNLLCFQLKMGLNSRVKTGKVANFLH